MWAGTQKQRRAVTDKPHSGFPRPRLGNFATQEIACGLAGRTRSIIMLRSSPALTVRALPRLRLGAYASLAFRQGFANPAHMVPADFSL